MLSLKKVGKSLIERLDLVINSDNCLHKKFNIEYKKIIANGTKIVHE